MVAAASGDSFTFENDQIVLSIERRNGAFEHRVFPKGTAASDLHLASLPAGADPVGVVAPKLDDLAVYERQGITEIRLKGSLDQHRFTVILSLPSSGPYVHVLVQDEVAGEIDLEFLESNYRLGRGATDFLFAPTIRPNDDHVIGEPSFKVPALIAQQDDVVLAVMADMDHMPAVRNPIRYCMEMEADHRIEPTPVLGFGLKDHEPEGLLYYQHRRDMRRRIGPATLSYGYYVFALRGQPARTGYRSILRFMWERFATPALQDEILTLPLPIEQYARYGIDYALRHLWVDLPLPNGEMAGGVMCGIRYPDDIWFHSLFNNLTGAYAFHHFGSTMDNPGWKTRGLRIRQLLLSSPQQQGIFPTIFQSQVRYARRDMRWIPSSHWMLTEGMEEACVTYQRQNYAKAIDWEHLYNTVQCSYTADWLLRWHREAEPNPESVAFCQSYGDFLLANQAKNGSIPTFFSQATLRADDILRYGAETACSGMFLAHLYIVTKDVRYLVAAQKAEAYLAEDVVAHCKWQDHETFFDSCAKPIDFYDPHTRQYAQATQCIGWAAEMYRLLAEGTKDDRYLEQGAAVLDYLSLFQQTWQAPFRSVPTVGGFAVGNGHAAWNDARQGLLAPIYAKYFEQTGLPEYFQRGLGAAKAGLSLMFLPEHGKIAPNLYDKGPLGHADENYAHRGEDRPALIGYCFDYQVGASLAALSFFQKRMGDLTISVKRAHGFAINAVRVRQLDIKADVIRCRLEPASTQLRRALIRVSDPALPAYRLIVNETDLGTLSADVLKDGVWWEFDTSSHKKGGKDGQASTPVRSVDSGALVASGRS